MLALGSIARAGIVVNDHWSDGTRTDPAQPVYSELGVDGDSDGNIESLWYSNGGTNTVTPGHMVTAPPSGSQSYQTYFTPEAFPVNIANIGDTVKVTWVFTPSGVANDAVNNTGQNFRMGLVDAPSASRLTADGTPPGAAYTGYAMFLNVDQTLRRSTPFQLLKRGTGTTNFLSTAGEWTALASNGTTGDPGYVSGQQYTFTWQLTHNASNGLDIDAKMAGAGLGPGGVGQLEVIFTDPTPAAFTFDMFGVRPSGAATSATSIDSTGFMVEASPVPVAPEPGSLALLSLGGLAALRRRNRHA